MTWRRPGERGLTRRDMWPSYLGGLLTEVVFITALGAIALVIAVLATAVR
ncbi:MAG: hypothetical protein JXP37_06825 [Coriobacteriia bacterium]|nr:hypothetical protein [Coriobacteriia bacterium]